MIGLHSLLLEKFFLLSLVLETKVFLQLEELAPDFFLAVLGDLLNHAQTSLCLLGFCDLDARCATVSGAWCLLCTRCVDSLVLAALVSHSHPSESISRRITRLAVVHGAVRVVHVEVVVVRVFSELQSSLFSQSLTLSKERILVKLLLQLQLSQKLRPIATHDEAGCVGSLLQLVKRDVNVPLRGPSQDRVRRDKLIEVRRVGTSSNV